MLSLLCLRGLFCFEFGVQRLLSVYYALIIYVVRFGATLVFLTTYELYQFVKDFKYFEYMCY